MFIFRFIIRLLLSRWFLTFVGTTLLAALVWEFGPMLPQLEEDWRRGVVILVLLLVWLVANVLLDARRRRRERVLMVGITQSPINTGPDLDAAGREEAEALAEKLSSAITLLKKARGTRGYLYEQPWYAIIGPPGAGKTTALLNAGLKFPLAAEMGQGAVAGVGGTRMCDWWFTEDAVLIDTAGRYTTQDSDAGVDKAGWEAFLELLKTTRPRQPLNGVLVAISLTEIATAPANERIAHARAIRRRIKELETKLSVRMPVYALFTKADLIAGFTEFFDDLDRDRRDQAWGVTFPLTKTEAGPAAAFADELRQLVARLDERLFARLQAERSPERRAAIAGFPTQVATLEQPLSAFLTEAFGGSRLDPAPFLRGAYLTSGTQEGTPIDRLTGAMARSFGLDQRRATSLRPEQGRSYFLGRLLRQVVFGEAMLVSEPPGAARRRLLIRGSAFAGVALGTMLFAGLVWASDASDQRDVDATARALAAYETTAHGLPLDPVNDADLQRLLPLLDQARALPHGVDSGEGSSMFSRMSLAQSAKLGAGSRAVYRHALANALLPRMVWRLEAQIRGNIGRPDFLYEATRVYLMLGGGGPLDRDLVREWMTLDWRATYPGAFNQPMLDELGRHLDALLAEPLPPVSLDGQLVAAARATFSRVPLASRVYSRIKPSAAAQRIPPWLPSDALGLAGLRVFVRASGKALTDGVPGFLTVNGFHKVLLPALGPAAREVAGESWVLGERSAISTGPAEMRALEQQVIALYEADYIAAWDAMLADLNVVPLRSLTQAAQDLYILASPQSPMRDLLVSASRQLTLSVPPTPTGAAGLAAQAQAAAQQAAASNVSSAESRVAAAMGTTMVSAPVLPPGHEIDDRYKPLRDLVAGGAAAPIEQVLKLLNDLQQQLAKLAAAPLGTAPPPTASGNDPALALRTEAQRQPQPLARWLGDMSTSGTVLRGGGARQQVVAAFNGPGGPASLCPIAVNGRYPFTAGATLETPMDDFGKLFSTGGLIDGFVNTQLRPYIDMSGKTWKPQIADGVPPPISPADLANFQRAAVIRDLFFSGGGTTPGVRFDITPTDLDEGARQVTLDFDGVAVTNVHGPSRATSITWPGSTRMQSVRLVFDPPPVGGTGVLSGSGPWAMFRLFARGTITQAGTPEKYTLAFKIGERSASFEIRASSVINPFAPGLLQDFRCPTVQ
ncbi:type VI secretion system membrane subunit TssM [Acidisphaera sp. L21]|uniref:type VI secretion system membrane subunit TssM n=1 Tax=Acidisphaera sp. L21 TaxID=1641851 RepID=UPI0020B15ECB|nr:type VI secretion system membrane subunit TssM [Acidisphaera sp. L21]